MMDALKHMGICRADAAVNCAAVHHTAAYAAMKHTGGAVE